MSEGQQAPGSPRAARSRSAASRSRLVALAACLACAATAALAAPGVAAQLPAGAAYAASGGVATTVRWSFEGAGHPNACRSWTRSDGSARVRVVARGPLTLAQLPGTGVVGGMQTEGEGRMNVERHVSYRIHEPGLTPDCYPCGPDSALGECEEPVPDEVGRRGCAPAASRASVLATVKGGALRVEGLARSAGILRRCSELLPRGVPTGPAEPALLVISFAGATRRIAALAPGESTRFSRATERGAGCGGRARGQLLSCARHITELTVRRVR